MSILSTIKSLVTLDPIYRATAAPIAVKQSGIEMFGPYGQRNADWSSIADMPRIQDAYRKCSIAYACVTLLADAVAESPLRVYQTVDGELEERSDHILRQLLAHPNPYMSEAEFQALTVMTMGMFGYAWVEKARSAAGLPVQLWPLRPDWLKYERRNGGAGFVYRVPGRDPYSIADENLILIPYRHDERQTSFGVTPLQIVAREVGIDVALTDLLKVFIDAGGIPPWIVKLSDTTPWDQTKADVFRETWRQRFGGSQAYSNIGILNPGMELVKVGDSIGDMAWPDLRGLTEAKIAQAFRVPLDLVQGRDAMQSGSLTTTEMTGAMAFLQNHGAQPLRMRIDGAFSRGLLPDFGVDGSWSLEFDTSGILALRENADAKSTRIRAEWDASLITQNQALTALGYPERGSDGEVFKIAFTTMLVPANGLIEANGPVLPPTTITASTNGRADTGAIAVRVAPCTYRDLKALSADEIETRASLLTTTRRERDKLTEIGARQLRKFFREQGRRIVGALPKSGPDIAVKQAINWDREDEILRALMEKFYGANGEAAFGTVSATAGVEISWDLANPNISRIMDQLGLRIVDISETTRTDVVNLIAQGQAEGLNLQQIADSVTGLFEETYKGRALTIARTETQVSYNMASQLGYQESGVVDSVEMVDNPDHDTDPGSDGLTCADRHGMVVPVDQMDTHVFAEHPNGSLAFIPLLSTPLGE